MKLLFAVTWMIVFSVSIASAAQLSIPASTAYLDPDGDGARVSPENGVTDWTDSSTAIVWYGHFPQAGRLSVQLQLRLQAKQSASLQMQVGQDSRQVTVTGTEVDSVIADFGEYFCEKPGYVAFRLTSLTPNVPPQVDVQELRLDGMATQGAHFNLLPRRNAASVHLSYPVDRDVQVAAFYCEMTGLKDPLWTYYMACGWHRGYFGMQVNSPTERRIIFSVWDSGGEAVDRAKVAADDRVTLVAKGDGVYSGDFGNEGTGGHSHLKYWWKTGEKQKFLVTAEPVSKTHTVYAGYYFHPDSKRWMLISAWKAPKEGGYLRGLYSFSENFVGRNGHVVRRALYGNQWLKTAAGKWQEITTAKFSHDVTGRKDRRDRFMGLEDGQFFLSHGGFIDGFTEYGTPFERPATGVSPETMDLPRLSF